jgi:hypothetical protein
VAVTVATALLRLADRIDREFASAAKAAVENHFDATIARGIDPYGEPWAPAEDGGRALPDVRGAVTVTVEGNALIVDLAAPYGFHHHGAGGSTESQSAKRSLKFRARKRADAGTPNKFHAPRRRILFDEGLPPKLEKTLAELVAKGVSNASK